VEIRRYDPRRDEAAVMALLRDEGEEWACYWAAPVAARYGEALARSATVVAAEGSRICGYARALDDSGFYAYVCDLLVAPDHRGHALGRRLLERLVQDLPGRTLYVMSDADGYYERLGYRREGSVFEVVASGP
jgi:GNAT superfamily N-acetyltransferase